jgi:hypothetical protein
VSVSAVLYPRWPPLLKIEISSNGQNCSILSQKVPKFELYKHNDELFNIYSLFSNLYNRSKWVMGFTSKLQVKKKIDRRVEPPDTFLEENHPMTISSKKFSY